MEKDHQSTQRQSRAAGNVDIAADHAIQAKSIAPPPFRVYSNAVIQKKEAQGEGEAETNTQDSELTYTNTNGSGVLQKQQAPAATTAAPSGNGFAAYMAQLRIIETAAVGDGYTTDQVVAAVRKLYYDSGAWNRVIAGSAGTAFPPSWQTDAATRTAVTYIRDTQVVSINGRETDIGHLLTGIDARNHAAGVSFAAGIVSMRSNQEVATYVGDVGSAVKHYVDNERRFYHIVVPRDDSKLRTYYNRYVSSPDMAGNADAYSMVWNAAQSLSQNLQTYYTNVGGVGENRRYTNFCTAIGLGTLRGGAFSGDNAAFRTTLQNEIYNFAVAYHFGQDGKVVGMATWEGTVNYNRGAEWMTEIFINDMVAKVGAETTAP